MAVVALAAEDRQTFSGRETAPHKFTRLFFHRTHLTN
jgi:hypothetical protein